MQTRRKFIKNSFLTGAGVLMAPVFSFPYTIAFDEDKQRRKAERLHNRILTLDSHCDTPLSILYNKTDMGIRNDPVISGSKVDFPRMKEGGLDASFFAVFIGQGKRDDDTNLLVKTQVRTIFEAIIDAVNKNPEMADIAMNPDDAYRIQKKGKRAIYISMENGYPIGKDIANIEEFYKLGARYITLCHSSNNDICDSSTDKNGPEHNGLSQFGREVIIEMNRLGMMIDVSHISDKSFYDVVELSKAPVIASHSSARAICDHPRNFNDDMLKAIKKNGGVVQLCILNSYIKTQRENPERDTAYEILDNKYKNFNELSPDVKEKAIMEWQQVEKDFPEEMATVKDAIDHIDHMVKVAGIDHVGIGTDFDGGGGIEGFFDISQAGNITYELVKRAYSDIEIEKIWGGNFMRVFRQVQANKG